MHTTDQKEHDNVEITTTARLADAGALALDAFARDVTGDPAIDSVVYDLHAYDAAVPAPSRYIAIAREGIVGWFADPDVAAMYAANRRSFRE